MKNKYWETLEIIVERKKKTVTNEKKSIPIENTAVSETS